MSFEGYYQMWCKNGHCWEQPYDYDGLTEEEWAVECKYDDCGKQAVMVNLVDDTNCDRYGEIPMQFLFLDKQKHDVYVVPKMVIVGHCLNETKTPITYHFHLDGMRISHHIGSFKHTYKDEEGVTIFPPHYDKNEFGCRLDFKNGVLKNPYEGFPRKEIIGD